MTGTRVIWAHNLLALPISNRTALRKNTTCFVEKMFRLVKWSNRLHCKYHNDMTSNIKHCTDTLWCQMNRVTNNSQHSHLKRVHLVLHSIASPERWNHAKHHEILQPYSHWNPFSFQSLPTIKISPIPYLRIRYVARFLSIHASVAIDYRRYQSVQSFFPSSSLLVAVLLFQFHSVSHASNILIPLDVCTPPVTIAIQASSQ